ncbi:hypothetical protein OIG38_05990 [Neisseria meningitidis]|nr:hypothetical protein [Neisseria meningitidis]
MDFSCGAASIATLLNRRRGQPLRQHFGEIFILKQHQTASVPQ